MVDTSNASRIEELIRMISYRSGKSADQLFERQNLASRLGDLLLAELEPLASSEKVIDAILDLCSATTQDGTPIVVAFNESRDQIERFERDLQDLVCEDELAIRIGLIHEQVSDGVLFRDRQNSAEVDGGYDGNFPQPW